MSEISVSVNGEGVASGVRVIKGNLKSLDNDVKRTFSLFEQFNTGLKGIATTNLNTVIKNLDKFNNVMKLMNATNYSNVASGLSNLSNALSTIGSVSFGNVSADMKALSKSIIAVDKIEFNRVAAGVRELKTGLELMGKTSISKASSDLAVLDKSLKGLAKADYDLVSLGVKEISSSLKILSAVNFSSIVADLEKFNQSLSSIKGNKLSGTIRDLSNSTKVLTTTLANQTKSVINSSNALAKYESKVASTNKANHAFTSSIGSSSMGLGLLNTAIIAVTTNLGAREIIAYADSWKQVTNLVKLATTSESELVSTRQRLIAISLDTRTDLSAQATLYNRLNIAQKELGVSSSEIMSVIHNVGRALGVTSTSALEARGALIQLSQAFGQDIVRAEEFNSIMEGTPKVARAIADGMEVSISQLRKLVLAGVVTNKDIFNSLQSQGTELKTEYEKVEKTISGAFTNLKTAVTVAIGNLDDGTGASKRFADSIMSLADVIMNSNLDVFAKDIESAGKQVIAIVGLIGLAKGAGGLIGSIYALETALVAAKNGWLALNLAMKSNLVIGTFVAVYTATQYLDKQFQNTFGQEARNRIDGINVAAGELGLKLIELQEAGGDKNLITKVLGDNPKELEKNLTLTVNRISELKKELTSIKAGNVPVALSQIPGRQEEIKQLEEAVAAINKYKTANLQSATAEALANEKKAEAAQVAKNAQTKLYLEWDKVKDKTLEAIKLGKQASDLLAKPQGISSASREKLLALEQAGNVAKQQAIKLLPDQIMREKELGSEHKNTIDQIQREISANAGLGNARESALKAQVSQGERLKNLMPDLEEMAGTGNLKAVELLQQYKVEIDKAANAASILEKEFGNASTGMSIETNTLIRETNQLSEAMKEIEKSDLKGLKLKGFLPDLEEAVAGGSTRAIEILKELEAQIKITDAAHAAFVAEYKQAPDTDEEKTLKKLKDFKKELPGALEMIEKLKTFQEEGADIIPALEEADLQGYESANVLIVDLKKNIALAAEEQAKLELEFGAVQTDPMEKQIQNLKDYIKEVQKSEKIIEKLKDMQYSFADSMENFESGNEYADSLLKSGLAIVDMLKEQQEEEKKLADLRLKASETTDLFEYLKLKKEINEVEADGPMKTLSAYQNLFGTLSSLAKENSKEQQALHNVQMAFAIAEMAMNAKVALTTGVEGVLTQFKGDPYTAFARVAAAAASVGSLLAMIGVSFSGFSGGSGGASTPVKATYQTGTVLGDKTASSESVSNIVEMLDDIHADEYHELQGIYSEMKELNSNITGLVSSLYIGGVGGFTPKDMGINTDLVQSTFADINDQIFSGIQDSMDMLGMKFIDPLTSAVTGFAGEIGNFIVSGLFGGGTKQEVFAQGLTTESAVSIRDLISGAVINAQKYASGETVTDRGWGRSDDRDPYRNVLDIGDTEEQKKAVDNLFTDIFTGLGETFVKIAGILGADVKTVQDYAFQIGDIDLKNLETGSEISEALNAAISTISDKAATELFGKLIGQYQTVGEVMVETAVRVASEKIVVLETVERLGSAFKDADIASLSIEFSQSLLKIAGGLESFTEAASTYYDKFFTDEEKQVDIGEMLTESLKDFEIDLPNTRELYRDVTEGLDLSTVAGQEAYWTMLKLAGSADEYYSYLEKVDEGLEDVVNNITDGINNILIASGRLSEVDVFKKDFKEKYGVTPSAEHSTEAVDFISTASKETIIGLADFFSVTVTEMLQDIADEASMVSNTLQNKLSLQSQLYTLLKDEVGLAGVVAQQRQIELATMEESLRPLQERVWALEDEAVAATLVADVLAEATAAFEEYISNFKSMLSTQQGLQDRYLKAANIGEGLFSQQQEIAGLYESFGKAAEPLISLVKSINDLERAADVAAKEQAKLNALKDLELSYAKAMGNEGVALAIERSNEINGYIELADTLGITGSALQDFIDKVSAIADETYSTTKLIGDTTYELAIRKLNAEGKLEEAAAMERARERKQYEGLGGDLFDFTKKQYQSDIDIQSGLIKANEDSKAKTIKDIEYINGLISGAGDSASDAVTAIDKQIGNVTKSIADIKLSEYNARMDSRNADWKVQEKEAIFKTQQEDKYIADILTERASVGDNKWTESLVRDLFAGLQGGYLEHFKTIGKNYGIELSDYSASLQPYIDDAEKLKSVWDATVLNLGKIPGLEEKLADLENTKLGVGEIDTSELQLKLKDLQDFLIGLDTFDTTKAQSKIAELQAKLDTLDPADFPDFAIMFDDILDLEALQEAAEKAAERISNLTSEIESLGLGDMAKDLLRRGVSDPEMFDIKYDAEAKRQEVFAIKDMSDVSRDFAINLINATEELQLLDLANEEAIKQQEIYEETLQANIDKVTEQISAYDDVIKSLDEFKESLYKTNVMLSPKQQLIEAQRQFAALSQQEATPENISKLTSIASEIFDLSEQTNTDANIYKKDVNDVLTVINGIQNKTLAANIVAKNDLEQLNKDLVNSQNAATKRLEDITLRSQELAKELFGISNTDSNYWNEGIFNSIGQVVTAINNLPSLLANSLLPLLNNVTPTSVVTPTTPTTTGSAILDAVQAGTGTKVNDLLQGTISAKLQQMVDNGTASGLAAAIAIAAASSAVRDSGVSIGQISDIVKNVPGFASGGDFAGGARMVGESGSEIEITGPSKILNNSTSMSVIANSEALRAEIVALRKQMAALLERQNMYMYETTKTIQKIDRREEKWDIDGQPPTRE